MTPTPRALTYSSDAGEIAILVDALLEQRPPEQAARLTCHTVAGDSPLSALGRVTEARQLGTIGYTPDLVAAEYAPYEDASTFVVVVDVASRSVTCAIRLLSGHSQTYDDLLDLGRPEAASELARLTADGEVGLDVATSGLDPTVHGTVLGLQSLALAFRCVVTHGVSHGISGFSALSTVASLRTVRSLGVPVHLLDVTPIPFVATEFLPWWTSFADVEDATQRRAQALLSHHSAVVPDSAAAQLASLARMIGTGEDADAFIDPTLR